MDGFRVVTAPSIPAHDFPKRENLRVEVARLPGASSNLNKRNDRRYGDPEQRKLKDGTSKLLCCASKNWHECIPCWGIAMPTLGSGYPGITRFMPAIFEAPFALQEWQKK